MDLLLSFVRTCLRKCFVNPTNKSNSSCQLVTCPLPALPFLNPVDEWALYHI
uniref:Uncharacterized protein n=1 Tax=Solanum tuberosum TaxID=4113 RepID=M1D1V6_SOLTU